MKTVLIVDDYVDNARMLQMLIGLIPDVTATVVYNGHTALESVRRHKPDVIFMDLQLPDMSGSEAASHIKQEFSDIIIICLSGYPSDMAENSEVFNEYWQKPVQFPKLQSFFAPPDVGA